MLPITNEVGVVQDKVVAVETALTTSPTLVEVEASKHPSPQRRNTFLPPHTNGGNQTNYASYHSAVELICQHIQAKFTGRCSWRSDLPLIQIGHSGIGDLVNCRSGNIN